MDPLELRRKNFIPPDNVPHETAIGVVYDSGNYEGTLDKLLEHVDVAGFRAEQERLRAEGVYRGDRLLAPTRRSAASRPRA